jgi:diguanylate cyclase (GGDEF)-like protein
MLFKTIKNTTTTLTVLAIFFSCAAVLIFSIQEHEQLYLEAVQSDLDGLSENMANDLVPLLATEPDMFDLTTMLLRLDRYENVKYAVIYNEAWVEQQVYISNAGSKNSVTLDINIENLKRHAKGVQIKDDELIALKLVGDKRLPLGYLLIVNDSAGPLNKSKLSLLKSALPLTLLVVLIVVGGSFWLQSRLFLPLTRLSNLAKKIQLTNDYSLRIDIRGKQEVAELCRDINSMMNTINAETDKNKLYTEKMIEQQKTMERLANFDGLTGLPNRQFFMETLRVELAKAQRKNVNLVLMYFDLDGFKGVNDSLGHETGDQLLIDVCQRARMLLREGDIISRLGGDEFLILLHNQPNDFEIIDIADRLVEGLSSPFDINSWEVQIGVSIGIAKAKDSCFNLSEFVSNADIAMYRSKLAGRSTHTVFVPEMMEDNKRKLQIANSISSAIKQEEFIAVYQAKVSADEQVVGYEALIRWNSASLGTVSPAEFIPIAEQSGKILPITHWMLERVCKDLNVILRNTKIATVISVNLSAHDIKSSGLLDFIKSLFKKYHVTPANVEFEVTESAYLENFDMANNFFTEIKNMGSSIALDDFGTGYSSLSYLTQIHLNTLKIDKQFVDNLGLSERSTLITKSIIEMAKQLKLKICAEGVETREQAEFLVNNGCHELQGYLFAKPILLEQVLKEQHIANLKGA